MKPKKQEEKESLTPGGVAVPLPLRIESPAFEGSLVTLFHLAKDGRIDLAGIPLAPVCSAYLEYLHEHADLDVDMAGASLLVLAYLIERKAWSLLPIADPPPPEELPELPEPTAYEFAPAVDTLENRFLERGNIFFRTGGGAQLDGYEPEIDLGDVKPEHLARALQRLLQKAKPVELDVLARPRPSLADVMSSIKQKFQEIKQGGFEEILPQNYTRLDVVFVFLAVLELVRIGTLTAELQEGEVWFRLKGS